MRDTVLCLCELGWLFLKVANYLKQALAPSGSSGGQQLGLVVQAFGFALQVDDSVMVVTMRDSFHT